MYFKLTNRRAHTHTPTILRPFWILSRTARVSQHQKGKTRKVKTNLDLLEQDMVSGSGISWAISKSAPWPTHNQEMKDLESFMTNEKTCTLLGSIVIVSENFLVQSTRWQYRKS